LETLHSDENLPHFVWESDFVPLQQVIESVLVYPAEVEILAVSRLAGFEVVVVVLDYLFAIFMTEGVIVRNMPLQVEKIQNASRNMSLRTIHSETAHRFVLADLVHLRTLFKLSYLSVRLSDVTSPVHKNLFEGFHFHHSIPYKFHLLVVPLIDQSVPPNASPLHRRAYGLS